MSNAAIVRAFFSRLERGDIIGAGAYLADEFTLGEPAPEPIGKERFIELLRCLTAAFPDISYGIGMLSEIADRVALVMHIAGTAHQVPGK
jgi:ketosteroid isomerase-like protein